MSGPRKILVFKLLDPGYVIEAELISYATIPYLAPPAAIKLPDRRAVLTKHISQLGQAVFSGVHLGVIPVHVRSNGVDIIQSPRRAHGGLVVKAYSLFVPVCV